MQINLSLAAAGALFDDLSTRTDLSAEMAEVREALRPLCVVDLTWRPHGPKALPCIHGLGWAVLFNESPSDSDTPETSLRDLESGHCYVLIGDHRAAFEDAAERGLPALLDVFQQLRADHRSPFSAA
ncbi:hypothetical protein ACRCPS_31095 [Pseudomonas aeruginosa]